MVAPFHGHSIIEEACLISRVPAAGQESDRLLPAQPSINHMAEHTWFLPSHNSYKAVLNEFMVWFSYLQYVFFVLL